MDLNGTKYLIVQSAVCTPGLHIHELNQTWTKTIWEKCACTEHVHNEHVIIPYKVHSKNYVVLGLASPPEVISSMWKDVGRM